VAAVLAQIRTDPVPTETYQRALQDREQMRRCCRSEFARHAVDAIVYPTVPLLPPPLGDDDTTTLNGEPVPVFATSIRNTSPASVTGAPALSLPCGTSSGGLPVGLSVETLPGTDDQLLAIAAALEPALSDDARRPTAFDRVFRRIMR
jgi:mandelamide amidase